MPLIATKGAASAQGFGEFAQAAAPVYIEDVFSTYLYTGIGAGSELAINNGVDLLTNGGLVWSKSRSDIQQHWWFDTARGMTYTDAKSLNSASTAAQASQGTNYIKATTTGYTLGTDAGATSPKTNNYTYASWTFREQPKFFDIVTYTGTGSTRSVSHSLDSTPGCIIIKCTSDADQWMVYHRSLGTSKFLYLNTTGSEQTFSWISSVGSTSFTLEGGSSLYNASGRTYVAYLFAHDAGGFGLTGSDNVITCGSYTGNGSATGPTINLGYEPQWVLIKQSTNAGTRWTITDNMRGFPVTSAAQQQILQPNTTEAEVGVMYIQPTATGFKVVDVDADVNQSGATYIYIAIRRGPMKTPTSGTSVFYPQAISQADTIDSTGVPFPPDLVNTFSRNGTNRTSTFSLFQFADRLRSLGIPNNTLSGSGCPSLISSSTNAEATSSTYIQLKGDGQNITRGSGWNSSNYGNWIDYFWRRAPGFFDVVCYTGTGANTTISHNLGVAPELLIVKGRSVAANWAVGNTTIGWANYLVLNSNIEARNASSIFNSTAPTSSVFSVGTSSWTNDAGGTYVAYLFATVAGVSKVGSYTGTGTTLQVNCGFTGGSRFVLIKRTDSTGDWYVWDSARGIVAGNDPYLLLNSTAAEVTNTDYVDTYSAGFEISSTAPADINANGGTFIFLAVA